MRKYENEGKAKLKNRGTVPLITFQGKKNKNRVIGGRFFTLQSEANSSAVIIIRPKIDRGTLITFKAE